MRVGPPTRRRAASNDVAKAKEEIPVDYAAKLDEALNRLHDEGRYRTFKVPAHSRGGEEIKVRITR